VIVLRVALETEALLRDRRELVPAPRRRLRDPLGG
jgi:hypothetical protein